MALNDDLRSEGVKHAVYLSRYQAGVAKRVLNELAKLDRDLVRKIRASSVSSDITQRRLQRLLDAVRDLIAEQYKAYRALLRGEIRGAAQYEMRFQKARLDRALAVADLGAVLPPTAAVYSIVLAQAATLAIELAVSGQAAARVDCRPATRRLHQGSRRHQDWRSGRRDNGGDRHADPRDQGGRLP